jgi:hypothetical protein
MTVLKSGNNSFSVRLRLAVLVTVGAALLLGCAAATFGAHPIAAAASGGFEPGDFAGTWNWMFEGKSFATMTLVQKGDQFSGSVTNGSINVDGDGKITSATVAPGASEIVKAMRDGDTLHIVTKDGDDTTDLWVTLKSAQVAEVSFAAPGANAPIPPIRAEKAK